MLWVHSKCTAIQMHTLFLQSSQENLAELLEVKFMKVWGAQSQWGSSNSQSKLTLATYPSLSSVRGSCWLRTSVL